MNGHCFFTQQVDQVLEQTIHDLKPASVHVLTDENTRRLVLPRLTNLHDAQGITVAAGDSHKDVQSLCQVWEALQQQQATRHSVLVNLGGGMVTDLGALAASTFKRGIPFINVPTTLLGAVDAAIGGKTGINLGGLKNEIGTFATPVAVVVSTIFFDTLPVTELKSGFGEMLKHALIKGKEQFDHLLNFDLAHVDLEDLLPRLEASVQVKRDIVSTDPFESGPRRALNLGHTVGHAMESLAMKRDQSVPHGYAVAWGLVTECVLSHMIWRFPSATLQQLATFVRDHYGAFHITCDDYPALLDLMRHDKKSHTGEINCTLLKACGTPVIDNVIADEDMRIALDIYRDMMGI